MVEIEFLDPDEPRPELDTAGEEIGREPTRPTRFTTGPLTAGLLLGGAVALALIAPFQELYVVRATRPRSAFLLSADGWGRMTGGELSPVPPGTHDPRFGIALAVGTALLAFYLVVLIGHSGGMALAGRLLQTAMAAAVAATGLMVGVLAAMWLVVDSRFAGYRANFDTDAAGPPPVGLAYGACIWLSAASAVAAALGLGAAGRWQRERRSGRNAEGHG